ncbi:glycoside hydrolase superfamily, partial [Ochromonadaceae sp. CCMP2298]
MVTAMSAAKLNTLHLHLTDAQSFPLMLEDVGGLRLSQLGIKGSFQGTNDEGQGTNDGKRYTLDDMRVLVKFAASYGVEIIPEIDMPAHALSWGNSAEFNSTVLRCPIAAKRAAPDTPLNVYPLDPSNPLTYTVVEAVLSQIAGVFSSKYMHIGGDEVHSGCWAESEKVMEWAGAKGLGVHRISAYFEKQVLEMVQRLGKVPVVWQGAMDTGSLHMGEGEGVGAVGGVGGTGTGTGTAGTGTQSQSHTNTTTPNPPNTTSTTTPTPPLAIVQPWKCWGGLALRSATAALSLGHPVVSAACWYLDYDSDWTAYLLADMGAQARGLARTGVGAGVGAGVGLERDIGDIGEMGNSSSADVGDIGNGTASSSSSAAAAVEATVSLLSPLQRLYLKQMAADLPMTTHHTPPIPPIPTSIPPLQGAGQAQGGEGQGEGHGQTQTQTLTTQDGGRELKRQRQRQRQRQRRKLQGPLTAPTSTTPTTPRDSFFATAASAGGGGEGAMWTEHVDCSNLGGGMWPRAAAVGARLWGMGGL